MIYPPQVAIVGRGQILERADAGDHRVSDGRAAAKFLVRLEALLHAPERL